LGCGKITEDTQASRFWRSGHCNIAVIVNQWI
jgi:hypothetical protein